MKSLSNAQYALKAAVRRAVTMAGGPSAAADMMRVDAARLSRYGNADAPEFAPIDVCFELDRAASEGVILRAWADLMGFDLVPRDQAAADGANDVTHIAGAIALEAGELVSTSIKASVDRVITINEGRSIYEAADDLQERVVDLKEAARRSMCAR